MFDGHCCHFFQIMLIVQFNATLQNVEETSEQKVSIIFIQKYQQYIVTPLN